MTACLDFSTAYDFRHRRPLQCPQVSGTASTGHRDVFTGVHTEVERLKQAMASMESDTVLHW